MEGYIKLHRKLKEWGWYKKPNTFRVFIDLLLSASYKDRVYMGIEVKRGQVLTTNLAIEQSLGLTAQEVRTALKQLEKTGEISKNSTSKTTKTGSLITICNFDSYQKIETPTNKESNKELTNKQQTNNKELTSNNKVKNEKNEINKELINHLDDFLKDFNFDFLKEESLELLQKDYLHLDLKESIRAIIEKMKTSFSSAGRGNIVTRKRAYFLKSLANANDEAKKGKGKIVNIGLIKARGKTLDSGLIESTSEEKNSLKTDKKWSSI